MPKYSVIYSSKTGNTRILANQIKSIITDEKDVFFIEVNKAIKFRELFENINSSSILFLGFWTDKGTCDAEMMILIEKLKNTKIFLFGTSGFGSDDKYFNRIIESIKNSIDKSNEVLGYFMCQGKMPISVKNRYEDFIRLYPDDVRYQKLLENFDEGLKHPSEVDIKNFINEIKPYLSDDLK